MTFGLNDWAIFRWNFAVKIFRGVTDSLTWKNGKCLRIDKTLEAKYGQAAIAALAIEDTYRRPTRHTRLAWGSGVSSESTSQTTADSRMGLGSWRKTNPFSLLLSFPFSPVFVVVEKVERTKQWSYWDCDGLINYIYLYLVYDKFRSFALAYSNLTLFYIAVLPEDITA